LILVNGMNIYDILHRNIEVLLDLLLRYVSETRGVGKGGRQRSVYGGDGEMARNGEEI
jgi:hypothetical protein